MTENKERVRGRANKWEQIDGIGEERVTWSKEMLKGKCELRRAQRWYGDERVTGGKGR